jgi:hypothetical protein
MAEDHFFVFDTNIGARVRFLPGAQKHGVNAEDQLHVVENASVVFRLEPSKGRSRSEWLFLGASLEGRMLEVIAILGSSVHFLVIHAMPMRPKWNHLWNLVQGVDET